MSSLLKKALLQLLALLLLAGVFFLQGSLNRDRDRLGLTRVQPLENAPPVLAFTTVALGGFRGLISNLLWLRAMDLQDQDKFFEMAQLADWITKLEPHYVQVWLVQAWNMAYNISVKFTDFADRWRWVQRGIELLRDEGLHRLVHGARRGQDDDSAREDVESVHERRVEGRVSTLEAFLDDLSVSQPRELHHRACLALSDLV
jgi:hypothetical protein